MRVYEELSEKEVCKQLRKFWKKNGFFYIRNQQGLGSKRGIADYTVVRDKITAFVEAKATKGKLSPYQEKFRDELKSHGGIFIVARSVEEFFVNWNEAQGLSPLDSGKYMEFLMEEEPYEETDNAGTKGE